MEIRPVKKVKELLALLDTAADFYKESRFPGKFNQEFFARWWAGVLSADVGVMIVAWEGERPIGGIGGVIAPEPNTGMLVASEFFWNVLPEFRGDPRGIAMKLLDSFEQWATLKGAKLITMPYSFSHTPKSVRSIYTKKGYREIEIKYVKQLAEEK